MESRGERTSSILPARTKFSPQEDQRLKEIVGRLGTANWDKVALELGGRTARQCRDRYNNYLQPSINNNPWTIEEEYILYQKYQEIGPQWAQMTYLFENRTCVSIKNHWSKIAKYPHRIERILNWKKSQGRNNTKSRASQKKSETIKKAVKPKVEKIEIEPVTVQEPETNEQANIPLDLSMLDPFIDTHNNIFWMCFDSALDVSF